MPEFRNLDVRVVDKDGDELQEWGVQHLHSQNKISTYIKSSTNVTFRVTVQPRLPLHSPDLPVACDIGPAMGDTRPLESANSHCSRGKFFTRSYIADKTEEKIYFGTANSKSLQEQRIPTLVIQKNSSNINGKAQLKPIVFSTAEPEAALLKSLALRAHQFGQMKELLRLHRLTTFLRHSSWMAAKRPTAKQSSTLIR